MINIDKVPHFIKYMGSKREILDYINTSIIDLNIQSEWLCDLFAGTSVISGALKNDFNIHSNDIQTYSSIFAHTYFSNCKNRFNPINLETIHKKVIYLVDEFYTKSLDLRFDYINTSSYDEMFKAEVNQRELISKHFDIGFNLFTRYYSGTYWSFEQCVWIDSIRAIAEEYSGTVEYYMIMSSLIFAMSYSTQSTGHFAQYRDITISNMNDILIYRKKDIWTLFERKFNEMISILDENPLKTHRITSLDYVDCLRIVNEGSIVYADPPYSNVHYSRFYHAIETLVKYDHPVVKYKGRYRDDRHQSPFDKRKEVQDAFILLFKGVKNTKSHLLLSYSDNGMITQDKILSIGKDIFGTQYEVNVQTKDYLHSKMGRSDEHQMDVKELIMSFKRK
jgi:adenine-specific DNA-methyltransferase